MMSPLTRAVLTTVALVVAIALIAVAPSSVTVPLGIVLIAGLLATGLVALLYTSPPAARATGNARWGVLGAISFSFIALAMFLADGPRMTLTAIGFAGLMVFRLAVMNGRGVPFGSLPAGSMSTAGLPAIRSIEGSDDKLRVPARPPAEGKRPREAAAARGMRRPTAVYWGAERHA
jgi:hypothetical protein